MIPLDDRGLRSRSGLAERLREIQPTAALQWSATGMALLIACSVLLSILETGGRWIIAACQTARWLWGLLFLVVIGVALCGAPDVASAFVQDQQEDVCARADILFCDNFEMRTSACYQNGTCAPIYKSPCTVATCGQNSGSEPPYICCAGNGSGAFTIVSTPTPADGTKALRMAYPSCNDVFGNCGAGWAEWTIPPGHRTVFIRMYIQLQAGWDNTRTNIYKVLELDSSSNFGSGNDWFFPHFHGPSTPPVPDLAVVTDVHPDHGYPSNPAVPLTPGQWHCVEIETTYNTGTNTNDGAIRTWVNGTQTHNLTNYTIQNAGSHDTGFMRLTTSGFSTTGLVQAQSIYIDRIVAATSRINCDGGGGGPIDTPRAPTGISISMAGAAPGRVLSTVVVSRTAVRDIILLLAPFFLIAGALLVHRELGLSHG